MREAGIGSRVVLLVAPAGWGPSVVLARFRDTVDNEDGPMTVVTRIDGSGLAGRYDGRVLVVAAARPGSDLVTELVKEAGPDLTGRVRRADADTGMDYSDRAELAVGAAARPARAGGGADRPADCHVRRGLRGRGCGYGGRARFQHRNG